MLQRPTQQTRGAICFPIVTLLIPTILPLADAQDVQNLQDETRQARTTGSVTKTP